MDKVCSSLIIFDYATESKAEIVLYIHQTHKNYGAGIKLQK